MKGTVKLSVLIGLITLVALFFLFKPEFSLITGKNDASAKIMTINESGDIVLSDNTVQNVNDYVDNMKSTLSKSITDLESKLDTKIAALKTSSDKLYQPKGDYIYNKDKIALARVLNNAQCGGDCRAVIDMWNDKNTHWQKGGFQWGQAGAQAYGHANQGKIYIVKA
tara:strand:- start:1183 stop:1683 length:501 start_codon:yes stop_codon:yes gene_type:complete